MSKKVMVVDDEPDVTFLVKEILTHEGFNVTEAHSGVEALERIGKDKPDLVLLDIMMPDMDGWEVSKRIKQNEGTKDTIVSMYSVKFEDEDKVKSFDYGQADWHLRKTTDRERFVNSVKWLFSKQIRRSNFSSSLF